MVRKAKKSEMLEVRLSYEKKEALRKRAQDDGQSVSGLVRRLIDDYLSQYEVGTSRNLMTEIAMKLKKLSLQKPKTTFVSLMAVLASGLLFIPSASAKELTLDVMGEFVSRPNADSTYTKLVEYKLVVESGDTTGFDFKLNGETYSVSLNANESIFEDGLEGVLLDVVLTQKSESQMNEIAHPKLSAVYGESATILKDDGTISFLLKIRPRLGG